MTTTLTRRETTPVLATVETALAAYRRLYPQRDFIVVGEASREAAVADATLSEVIGKLVSSACRRSHPAAPVRVRVRDVAGGVELQVRDESNGLCPEDVAEIQGPTRLPRLVDDAAVRAAWAARDEGILVDVDSRHGVGARVTLTLPLPVEVALD